MEKTKNTPPRVILAQLAVKVRRAAAGFFGGYKNLLLMAAYILLPVAAGMWVKMQFVPMSPAWTLLIAASLLFPALVFADCPRLCCLFIAAAVYFPYAACVLHYLTFGTIIDRGAMIAIFDTNASEASGFVLSYLNWKNVSATIVFVSAIVFALIRIRPFDKIKGISALRKFFFLVFAIAAMRGVYGPNPEKWRLALHDFRDAYIEYRRELQRLETARRRKFPKFKGISEIFKGKPQTFVVVFGEAAAREHFSLYGYGRDTNPFLGKIRAELALFSNVASSHPQTHTSFQKMMTFAEFGDMEPMFSKGSVINFFKDAGFKTFWLSNQESSGGGGYLQIATREADVSQFAEDLAKQTGKERTYDGDLAAALDKALGDPAPKKALFLHLSGSHAPYKSRYPDGFAVFGGAKDRVGRNIDDYDNSIRYTDYVLSGFIERLRKERAPSYLLYVPDHGEDAIDERSSFDHGTSNMRDNMFEIPFIVWLSPEYRKSRPGFLDGINKARRFNTQHLDHTVMDLSGLSHPDVDMKKSLFSKSYAEPEVHIIK